MMNDLEVPFALTGFQIDTDQTLAEQIVAGAMPSIEIGRRGFDGKIDKPQFFIYGNLSPDAGVAVGRPGIILPCVVAELSRLGNCVEGPQHFARTHIEGADLAFAVVVR